MLRTILNKHTLSTLCVAACVLASLTGCSTRDVLALTGASVGGVVGSQTGDKDTESTLAGAVVGGVVGGITGYAYEKGKKKGSEQAIAQAKGNYAKGEFWDRQEASAHSNMNGRVVYYNLTVPRGNIRAGGIIEDEHTISIPIVE